MSQPSPDPGRQRPLTADADLRVPSTGGLTLALHDLGGPAGADVPVLLVHATGFHGRVWGPCTAHLPFHCWAPDIRGHGASPLPASAFTGDEPDPALLSWERVTDDVLATADVVARRSGVTGGLLAVGHSMGGAALLRAEQRQPGTFRALYVYEPIAFPPSFFVNGRTNPLAAGARRRRPRFESFDAAIANYSSKPPLSLLDPAALDAYVRHGFTETDDGAVTLACTPAVEATIFSQGMLHETFEHLGEVSCPVTVASGGAESGPGPAVAAPFVAEALPRAELVVHPALGHFGPLEDPATVAADIAARLPPH